MNHLPFILAAFFGGSLVAMYACHLIADDKGDQKRYTRGVLLNYVVITIWIAMVVGS
ncbi:MAG: hypothetical protein ACREUA_03280 [Burkholderiales bacterium]